MNHATHSGLDSGLDQDLSDASSLPDVPASQKRVILRLRVSDFDGQGRAWQDYPDAIRTFLVWYGRPASEYGPYWTDWKHYAHVEPFQAADVPQKRFHIMLDMEYKASPRYISDDTLPREVPHEVYRIIRNREGKL